MLTFRESVMMVDVGEMGDSVILNLNCKMGDVSL